MTKVNLSRIHGSFQDARAIHPDFRSLPLVPTRREIPRRRCSKKGATAFFGPMLKGPQTMSKEGNVDNGLRKILFLPGSRRNGKGLARDQRHLLSFLYGLSKSLYRFSSMQLPCRAFLRRSADRDDSVSLSVSEQHMAETLRFYYVFVGFLEVISRWLRWKSGGVSVHLLPLATIRSKPFSRLHMLG